MALTEKPLISLAEIALELGISKETLRQAAARGDVKTVPMGGRIFMPAAELKRIQRVGFGGRKNSAARKHKAR